MAHHLQPNLSMQDVYNVPGEIIVLVLCTMKQWIVNLFTSEGSNFPTNVSTIATLKVQVMLKLFSEKKTKKTHKAIFLLPHGHRYICL